MNNYVLQIRKNYILKGGFIMKPKKSGPETVFYTEATVKITIDDECLTSIKKATALVKQRKLRVSPVYHGKLDALLEDYINRLALWTHKFLRIYEDFDCNAKYLTRNEDDQYNFWMEYGEIQSILYEIMNTGIVDASAGQTTAANRTVSILEAANTAKG